MFRAGFQLIVLLLVVKCCHSSNCDGNSFYYRGLCAQCPINSVRINNRCAPCGANMIAVNGNCACKENHQYIGGQCTLIQKAKSDCGDCDNCDSRCGIVDGCTEVQGCSSAIEIQPVEIQPSENGLRSFRNYVNVTNLINNPVNVNVVTSSNSSNVNTVKGEPQGEVVQPNAQIVEKIVRVPYPVPKPVPVTNIVHLPKPYPVHIKERVAVPQPYPVPVPQHVPVIQHVPVPVEKIIRQPVPVTRLVPVPVPVNQPVLVPQPVIQTIPAPQVVRGCDLQYQFPQLRCGQYTTDCSNCNNLDCFNACRYAFRNFNNNFGNTGINGIELNTPNIGIANNGISGVQPIGMNNFNHENNAINSFGNRIFERGNMGGLPTRSFK